MNTSTLKSNKDFSTSKSKPKSKVSVSPRKNVLSPKSQQKKIRSNQQSLISKMKAMRQKLCNTLDAYILILETNAPLRCLEHNSVLSLYCETQNKLLCANCVYRSNIHKLHRVFPIEKCYKQIARDVEQITRQTQREIKWADDSTKAIQQFFNDQEKNTNQAILTLAQMYDEIHIQLQKSYEQAKKKLITVMNSQFAKKQSLMLQVQFFKNIFTKNKPVVLENFPQNSDTSTTQYFLIFNHLIGNALMQFGKLDGNKVVDGHSKIKNLQKKQLYKIGQMKQVLSSWKQFDQQKQAQLQQRVKQKLAHKQKQREPARSKQFKRQQPKIIN